MNSICASRSLPTLLYWYRCIQNGKKPIFFGAMGAAFAALTIRSDSIARSPIRASLLFGVSALLFFLAWKVDNTIKKAILQKINDRFVERKRSTRYLHNSCQMIHAAVMDGNRDAVQFLIDEERPDVNECMLYHETGHGEWLVYNKSPLYLAVESRNVDMVKCLLKAGALLGGDFGYSRETELHRAVKQAEVPLVQLLLLAERAQKPSLLEDEDRTGSYVNRVDRYQETPLFHLTLYPLGAYFQKAAADIVQEMIRAGANVNARDSVGNTTIHVAVRRKNTALIKALLRAGADINAQNESGNTPMHLAVAMGNAVLVEALLNAEADVSIENCNGCTPSQLTEDFDILQLFIEHKKKLAKAIKTTTKLPKELCQIAVEYQTGHLEGLADAMHFLFNQKEG